MLLSIWVLFIASIQLIDGKDLSMIWLMLVIWTLMAQPIMTQINSGTVLRLRMQSRYFYHTQRIAMLVQAISLNLPMALISWLFSGDFYLGLNLFLVSELLCWALCLIDSLVQKASSLMTMQMLFIPMIAPVTALGALSVAKPVMVLRLLLGIWLIIYQLGVRLSYLVFRVGNAG
ncbi:hypothetical protein OAT84_01920 [Gammaproteobacteria bacterium]|nr:hypothetical protein [Gammaproteobacteria bacterium]